jgi:hypothetical protein
MTYRGQPITADTTALNDGQLNQPYSDSVQASNGTVPFTWSLAGGQFPPGLSLSSATGVITGTPTSGGVYSCSLKVVESGAGTAVTKFFTIKIILTTPGESSSAAAGIFQAPKVLPGPSSATILYNLQAKGSIRIAVYDIKGTLVKKLLEGIGEAGAHSVRWNGNTGTGLYFVRLNLAGKNYTLKLVICR